jgi:hypothetical protein
MSEVLSTVSEGEAEEIQKDIEKYGFPLEVKTTGILEAKGWELTNQATFQDIETEKFRTVDIIAQKSLLFKPDNLSIELLLVVECKGFFRKPKPWVFYALPYNQNEDEMRRKTVASTQFGVSPVAYQRKYSNQIIRKMVKEFLLGIHFKSPIFSKLGYIPFEAFTEGETKSIHKATMQVCNAIFYYERLIDEEQSTFPFGTLFMPIIVTNEHLYTYNGKQLNREDGLFYYVTYAHSAFMFEVLSENFLSQYLDFLASQITVFQRSQVQKAKTEADL